MSSRFSSLFGHDLFGKPLHTFPDHALSVNRTGGGRDNGKSGAFGVLRPCPADPVWFTSRLHPVFHCARVCWASASYWSPPGRPWPVEPLSIACPAARRRPSG